MVDPNKAYRDKDKPDSADTKDVRDLLSMLGICANCGRPVLIELRGINTLYLPDVICRTCRKGG